VTDVMIKVIAVQVMPSQTFSHHHMIVMVGEGRQVVIAVSAPRRWQRVGVEHRQPPAVSWRTLCMCECRKCACACMLVGQGGKRASKVPGQQSVGA
jgi:hypothetical protein